MCTAMRNKELRDRVTGAISILRNLGFSEDDIVEATMKEYDVSREYVLEVLHELAA